MRYPHLFSRLYNTPLMLHPDKASVIENVFRTYASGLVVDKPEIVAASSYTAPNGTKKPYQVTSGGVGIIPVMGTLVQRASGMDAMSGMTSYSSINNLLDQATADRDVKGILLEVDSLGGEVSGLYDLADAIYAARQAKPVWTIVNEQAYSAGYAIACSAQKLFLPRTAGVGSIGVIALHVDQSKRDTAQGYVYTAIFAGDKKNDFSSHAPLSDSAMADLQAEIDRLRILFVDTVARNRAISPDLVMSTQAGTMNPQQAVDDGFADGIATMQETIAMLEAEVQVKPLKPAQFGATRKETRMSTNQESALISAETQAAINQARTEGHRAGAAAERERIGAILQSEESQGREAMAQTFALETDMDAATAKKLLAKSPAAAQKPTGNTDFNQAMANVTNPKIGADGNGAGEQELSPEAQAEAMALRILGAGKKVLLK
ncbi:S49 family peptidase [Undibacterium sp. Di26W]|uniref:S49 family peptidase n=1 Tax=Undibacterium sp. Di26W TaxID=3413035 RepID=UPI003BF38F6F